MAIDFSILDVDVGNACEDPNADKLRDAFIKVNQRFGFIEAIIPENLVSYPEPIITNSEIILNSTATQDINLTGYYFSPVTTVTMEGQTVNSITFIDDRNLVVNVTVGAPLGDYDVTVDNGNDVTYTDLIQVVPLDNIRNNLTAPNKLIYDALADNEWMEITQAEYNDLRDNMTSVDVVDIDEITFTTAIDNDITQPGFTTSNFASHSQVNTIPADSYLYAFKVKYSVAGSQGNSKRVKVGTSNNSGFSDVGGTLPAHTVAGTLVNYFVLKGNTITTQPSLDSYLGIYTGVNPGVNVYSIPLGGGNEIYYRSGNGSVLPNQYSSAPCIQGLSTTDLQW